MIAVLCGAMVCAGAEDPYAWPLDLPRQLTSSFAEYRVGRLHAGIDLRTGDIGKDVFAAGDGYVSRVRCSPWGYGKAVYLHLADGHSVVYGHLNAFEGEVAEYVRRAQHAKQEYTVDLFPEPGQFPVTRGQLIAKSGQTGIGVPHLHLEYRDAQEQPINPHLLGITWPDTTRPVIDKVLIVPDGPGSTLNGDLEPLVRTVRATGPGQYTCDPVSAWGRIGFGLDVIDPANNGASKLGIHTLRTEAAGNDLFQVVNDRISYDTNNSGAVAYHPFYLSEGPFLLQWLWPGNRSESFQSAPGDGWLTVGETPVEVRIEAQDFLGNAATLTIPIQPEVPLPEEPPADSAQATGTGKADVECVGTWLLLTVRFTAPEPVLPELEIAASTAQSPGRFRRVSAKLFRAGYAPAPGTHEVTLRVRHPRLEPFERQIDVFHRGDQPRTVDLGPARLGVASDSPYGVLFARGYATGGESPPIPLLGDPFRIWPDKSPIDEPVSLSFPMPNGAEDPRRVHIYRKCSWGWARQDTERTAGRLATTTRTLGTFAVLEDDQAPRISGVTPAQGARLTSARPTIRASVSDVGSGIETATVTCNGAWLLAEYDPERGVVQWAKDEDLPAGDKELVFTISDTAGNVTIVRRNVQGP